MFTGGGTVIDGLLPFIGVVFYTPRTGSTCMARALVAGTGFEITYSDITDNLNAQCSDADYKMNPEFLEPSEAQLLTLRDKPKSYDGTIIKVQAVYRRYMGPHRYRVVVMRRDRGEIIESTDAATAKRASGPVRVAPHLDMLMDRATEELRYRTDVISVHTCRYGHEFVYNPRPFFEQLEHDGWPIDPAKASAIIDPDKYRHRCQPESLHRATP